MVHVDVEEERKEILKRYRKLLKQAKPVLKPGDTKLIKKSFNISLYAHKVLRRKSGEPYIYHPLEVALVCVEEIGLGTTSIIAALLHDVVEDTDMELEDIEREFGHKVMTIIDGLTKISGVFEYGSSQQAENFRFGSGLEVLNDRIVDRGDGNRAFDLRAITRRRSHDDGVEPPLILFLGGRLGSDFLRLSYASKRKRHAQGKRGRTGTVNGFGHFSPPRQTDGWFQLCKAPLILV